MKPHAVLEMVRILVVLTGFQRVVGVEYCWEDFVANCSHNEVIFMQKAHYGRMQLGRCLKTDFYVGCYKDVIEYMDRKCSGRHHCTVAIPDTQLQVESGCIEDLVAYLNASYICVPAAYPKDSTIGHCSPDQVAVHTNTFGYVSSLVSLETMTGLQDCPWEISVPKGQKINVTLLDFSLDKRRDPTDNVCARYATLRDAAGTTDITVCGASTRSKVIYMSDSNRLVIAVNSALANSKQNMPYFLLRYEAVGCADLPAPSGGWMERRDHKLTVGCNETGEARHLVCNGDKWVGETLNCTESTQTTTKDAQGFVRKEVPFGLVLAIVIGVILGIIIGSLLLGIVLYTQSRLKKRRREGCSHAQGGGLNELEKTQILQSGNYGYAHVWELQQLRSGSEGPGSDPRDTVRATTTTVCPGGEFGAHLGKPPGYSRSNSKDHSYESPRMNTMGAHIHTLGGGGGGPRLMEPCSATLIPKRHEFDVHIKTSVGGGGGGGGGGTTNTTAVKAGGDGTEARYTD